MKSIWKDMCNGMSLLAWVPGGTELLVIALVVLLLFGGRKIPELMRGLGRGMKEFKDASSGKDDSNSSDKDA